MFGIPNIAVKAQQEPRPISPKFDRNHDTNNHSHSIKFTPKSWMATVNAPISPNSIRKGISALASSLTAPADIGTAIKIPLVNSNDSTNTLRGKVMQFLHKPTILKDESLMQEPHRHINGLEHLSEVAHINATDLVIEKTSRNKTVQNKRIKIKACPFCRRYLLNRTALLIGENVDNVRVIESEENVHYLGMRSSRSSESEREHNTSRFEYNENYRNRLSRSSDVQVKSNLPNINEMTKTKHTKVLVEGWLLKKGSGNDWLGDTKYKPRWTRLVLALFSDTRIALPILQVYWFENSLSPSSSIILENCHVKPVNKDPAEWKNIHCFEIICHSNTVQEKAHPRIFATSADERNEWVYAINLAIKDYKKGNGEDNVQTKVKQKKIKKTSKTISNSSRWKEGSFSGQ